MGEKIQENREGIQSTRIREGVSFFNAASALLSDFPERSQEITKKRFGITEEKPQTLEKIGKDYNITRERVRQIVTDTLNKISIKENNPLFEKAEERIVFTIESNSGIIKESDAIKKLCKEEKKEANSLIFLRGCSKKIFVAEEEEIEKVWFLDRSKFERAKKAGSLIKNILKREKRLLSDEEIVKKFRTEDLETTETEIIHWAQTLSQVKKNKFGKWGMSDWVEISPKGTRERIYAVLKEQGRPLHFTDIAKLIDQYGLSKRKAHIQTVHNELIKNERFVLIGRGIYALKEWGYAKGTIRDVLEYILRKSKRSLSREEIIKEVFKMRQVKKATILINLSNEKLFVKQNNFYSVRENKI